MKKFINVLVTISLLFSFSFFVKPVEAASTKYNHNHTSYTCYKMSYYGHNDICLYMGVLL